jgi:hypothetical protein
MHDEDGRLTFLLHHVEDVTDQVVRWGRFEGDPTARSWASSASNSPVVVLTKWTEPQASQVTETCEFARVQSAIHRTQKPMLDVHAGARTPEEDVAIHTRDHELRSAAAKFRIST